MNLKKQVNSSMPRVNSVTRISFRFFAVVIGLTLLTLLVLRTGPQVIWTQVHKVGLGLLLIIIIGGLAYFIRTWVWRLTFACDIFSFFKKMIAFRKSHPSLCRSRFWREDISWYGTGSEVDLSPSSHSLAFCLHGSSQGDDDMYVTINGYWQELQFKIQEGSPTDWVRIVDTSLPSGQDFLDSGVTLEQIAYRVAPPSVVVFVRRRKIAKKA